MPQTFADPRQRPLTATALAGFAADNCLPTCRVCGNALAVGDYVDPHHPYCHAGNIHARCVAGAPEPKRNR